jgi:RHS repeat-associated protein
LRTIRISNYPHYDQVGSLKAISDSSGATIKQVDYDSFGNVISDTNTSMTTPFGFAGGLHDRDTGLVRFGFRDYDPAIGRWTAKDPIDFAGGDVNLFQYVSADPVNFVDPQGLILRKDTAGTWLPVLDRIRRTDSGRDLIKKLEDSPETCTLHEAPCGQGAFYNPDRRSISIAPDYQRSIDVPGGKEDASLERMLAHELGHAMEHDRGNQDAPEWQIIRRYENCHRS